MRTAPAKPAQGLDDACLVPRLNDRTSRLTEADSLEQITPPEMLLNSGQIFPAEAGNMFVHSVIPPLAPEFYPFQYGMFCEETGAFGEVPLAISITVS